jgi:hypothetical protein
MSDDPKPAAAGKEHEAPNATLSPGAKGDKGVAAVAPTPSAASTSPSPSPGAWKTIVSYLKDMKDVLAGIAAIAAAIAFALNYFATSRSLNCFKAESRKNNELVQTILQINDLTASWQLSNVKIRQLDTKSKSPQVQIDSAEHEALTKDIVQTQAQIDDITTKLKAARERKLSLERATEPCE